jgi:hypothetical protein
MVLESIFFAPSRKQPARHGASMREGLQSTESGGDYHDRIFNAEVPWVLQVDGYRYKKEPN